MSFETWFRILFAIVALGLASFLVANLITGRSRAGGLIVERRSEPAAYWGAVGMTAIMATGLAIAAVQPSEDARLPLLFLSVIGGQLFEMLVSGTVQMPKATYVRSDRPGPYWRWVAFHAAIVALLIAFLIAQQTRFTIL